MSGERSPRRPSDGALAIAKFKVLIQCPPANQPSTSSPAATPKFSRAGGAGRGFAVANKTTFAKEFLPHEVKCLRFYNADEIARGLSPLDPSAGAINAGRLLLSEVRDSIDYLPLARRLGALGQSSTPRETAGDFVDC